MKEFQFFVLSGRLIRKLSITGSNGNFEIPVYDIPDGTYIISTIDENGNLYQEQVAVKH